MVPKFVASHPVAFTSLTWRYKWPAVSWNATVMQKLNWDQRKQRERGHGGKVRWASVTRLKLLKYFGQLQTNWTLLNTEEPWRAACVFVYCYLFTPSFPCFLNFLSWPWSSLCVAIAFPSTKLPLCLLEFALLLDLALRNFSLFSFSNSNIETFERFQFILSWLINGSKDTIGRFPCLSNQVQPQLHV